MKKSIIIAAVLLLSFTALAQDWRSIYNKYSDYEDVSAVYISPSMFKLIGKIPDLPVGDSGVDISPIINSLSGFYLLDSENPSINRSLQADAEKFVKNGTYDLLMEIKDSGEKVKIFTCGNDKVINSLVMTSFEDNECVFIAISGEILRSELEKIIASPAVSGMLKESL